MDDLFKYTEQEMGHLVLDMYPRMIAYIRRMLGRGSVQDAEDVFSGVLESFLEKKPQLHSGRVKAYLFRSVRNACINLVTRKTAERRSVPFSALSAQDYDDICMAEFDDGLTDTQDAIGGGMQLSDILAFVDELPPRTREVFVQSRIEGRKLKDIAADMGITVRAVQHHITLSIKKFRQRFPKWLT